jgi:uncharacterized membrane protein YfcA
MLHTLFLLAVGLIVGGMNAIAGGGMLIGFPALLASGLTALSATATGCIIGLPGQLASAYGYRRYLQTVPKRYALLLIPCMVGAAIGASLLRRTPSSAFEEFVPWLILLAVGLFAFQPWLQMHLRRHMASKRKPVGLFIWIGLALFPLAIYGGYFGVGFGFVILAFLGFTSLKDIHQMNAMKNVAASGIGLMSLIVLARGPFINWHAGLIMAVGSTIGGFGGAKLAQKVPSHAIRVVVIAIGTVTAAYIAISGVK